MYRMYYMYNIHLDIHICQLITTMSPIKWTQQVFKPEVWPPKNGASQGLKFWPALGRWRQVPAGIWSAPLISPVIPDVQKIPILEALSGSQIFTNFLGQQKWPEHFWSRSEIWTRSHVPDLILRRWMLDIDITWYKHNYKLD